MWYNKKFFKVSISILLVLLILFMSFQLFPLFQLFFQFITTLFFPVFIAGIFYYIFRPLVRFFDRKKISRYISLTVIYLSLFIIISVLISLVWPYMQKQIAEFSAFPTEKLKEVENKTVDIMNWFNLYSLSHEQLRQYLLYYLQKITLWFTGGVIANIASVTKVATYFVITPFILFYFLKDDHQFSQKFLKFVPENYKITAKQTLHDIDDTLSSYISGQVLVAFIVAFLIYIGYLIIGLDYTFLLALIAFIFNLIPFGGPIISTIPALFIGLSQSPFMAIKVLIVVCAVHLIDLNLISPKIVGQRLNIHPVTIILLLVAGVSLFGFLSLFFIIPAYAVLKTFFLDFWEKKVIESDVI